MDADLARTGLTRYRSVLDRVQFDHYLGECFRLSSHRVFPGGRLVWVGKTSLFAKEEQFANLGVTFSWGGAQVSAREQYEQAPGDGPNRMPTSEESLGVRRLRNTPRQFSVRDAEGWS